MGKVIGSKSANDFPEGEELLGTEIELALLLEHASRVLERFTAEEGSPIKESSGE